jgi:hypothetical protein
MSLTNRAALANFHDLGAGVAQLVEQRIRNAQVNGSIPFAGSTIPASSGRQE